ncbi:MAG: cysteine--tRNA ligase, partial [Candidatus Spechtbacterales bacterium]
MAIKLYDTLSRKKGGLNPRSGKKIGIFVCGPTVYDYSHIGHARTYIAFDAFVKYLRSREYEVRYVQNITDIDDKIIARANDLKQDPRDLARNFETEYYHDMESLGVNSVDKYACATNYIPQIISQVERLMAGGYAYEIENEGIYFDISKFRDYGKLSRRTVEQAEDAVSRIDKSIKKRNKGDFALWKYEKAGEPKWPSPWGDGRPGWHIEDTAITETEFGAQYDIHGGARDLIFPHHESEIAQMETISAKVPLVNYWVHTGFLTVNGEKMSKSLGNFITIHEFLRERSKEALRLLVLSS